MNDLLHQEKHKETLRIAFAHVATSIRGFVDRCTADLSSDTGSLQDQLSAVTDRRDSFEGQTKDMVEAEKAAAAQDAAGIVVNPHTPETVHTLRAAWDGLAQVYAKAIEAIEAQIMAEATAGLTPDQIAEANEVFTEFDKDGNGNLNLSEFYDCCTSLGIVLSKRRSRSSSRCNGYR